MPPEGPSLAAHMSHTAFYQEKVQGSKKIKRREGTEETLQLPNSLQDPYRKACWVTKSPRCVTRLIMEAHHDTPSLATRDSLPSSHSLCQVCAHQTCKRETGPTAARATSIGQQPQSRVSSGQHAHTLPIQGQKRPFSPASWPCAALIVWCKYFVPVLFLSFVCVLALPHPKDTPGGGGLYLQVWNQERFLTHHTRWKQPSPPQDNFPGSPGVSLGS